MKKLSTDPNRLLTPLMWEALDKAASAEGLGSWDYASGIVGALKADGLVDLVVSTHRYVVSSHGQARRAIRLMDAANASRERLGFPPFTA